jgi:hypothetical protein
MMMLFVFLVDVPCVFQLRFFAVFVLLLRCCVSALLCMLLLGLLWPVPVSRFSPLGVVVVVWPFGL